MKFIERLRSIGKREQTAKVIEVTTTEMIDATNKLSLVRNNVPMHQGQRSFEAAAQTRINQSWHGAGLSLNQEIKFSLRRLRAICRDLAQNDPYVKKYLRTCIKYIIGPEGFTVKCKAYDWIKGKDGKSTKQYDAVTNGMIEDLFWEWSKKKTCTVTGDQSFRQFLATVVQSKKVDGEVFIKKVYQNRKENPFVYTLQAIESQMVDESWNKVLENGNVIVMGIEYDNYFKPQAYWFRKHIERVDPVISYYSRQFERVPADQVLHYYTKEFVGQFRGYPDFVNIANRIKTLKGFEEAALINARSSAMKTMVLKYSNQQLGELTRASIPGAQDADDGSIQYQVEPGTVYVVPKGMEMDNYNPAYPQGEHKSFTESQLYAVAAGLDIDYPTLSANLSGVNYTSIRHGMLDSRLAYKREQADIREDIIEPVFADVLEMSMLTGKLNLPIEKFEKFNKPKIIGYTGDWVDPLKDGRASIEGIEALTESMEDVLAEKGKDLEEHLDQLAYEKEQMNKRGLIRADLKGDIPKDVSGDKKSVAEEG